MLVWQLYQSQNIYIVMVGVEVWTQQQLIAYDLSNPDSFLDNFQAYKQQHITAHSDDVQLFT